MADKELVIKIPEDIYMHLCNGGNIGASLLIENAIKTGIPLPKGHGDLKDQKDLAKSLYDYQWIDQLTYMEVTNRLISAPTIIAEDKEQEDGNVV